MAEKNKDRLPHLLVKKTATTSPYTRPKGPRGSEFKTPLRNRAQHADDLIRQLELAREQEAGIIQSQKAFGLDAGNGIYLTFESEPNFDLKAQSLEFQRGGIELCSIKKVGEQTVATVFVPEGKLTYFLKRIGEYRDEDSSPRSPGKPPKRKNKDLVESISAIKLAALRELWTDCWANKYRYASHGLRFDVRRPLESLEAFQQRVNQQARDDESSPNRYTVKESGKWILGENLRGLGSAHSDTWFGNAAELAQRGHVAVYPVAGWWKKRANLERWGQRARYALVVTIKTSGVATDIYAPVVNQITAVQVAV